jgi:hypothetical protein
MKKPEPEEANEKKTKEKRIYVSRNGRRGRPGDEPG